MGLSMSSRGQETKRQKTEEVPKKSRYVPFNLAELEAEVADVRADPPWYVSDVGKLTVPTTSCDENGNLVFRTGTESEWPWDLTVAVCGEEGDAAYGSPFLIRLRFDPDLYPSKLCIVRFQCVFHHALTDDSGGMAMPFYNALPRDDRGCCTIRGTLKHVHDFLVDPMKAWKLPTDKLPLRLTRTIDAYKKMNTERLEVIAKYRKQVKHPELFSSPLDVKEEWFHPDFWRAHTAGTSQGWRALLEEHLPGEVFSFKMFSDGFLDILVEEIFNFYDSGLPARRPNSMNNYGIILNEIGLEPLINHFQQMLQPIGELLWPGPGSDWDGHHCFIVRYREKEDLGLDMHTDDSDVTFNVCLGLEFAGAGLQFCGLMGAPNHRKHTYTYKHVKGACVCHLGRKRHGADDIASGERLNLILWNHSSTYRQTEEYNNVPYSTEEGPPDSVCVSYTHDRDYGNYKEYPAGKEKFRGRGWCPRKSFEYDGFKPRCSSCCVQRLCHRR